jgi:hypothetical protein
MKHLKLTLSVVLILAGLLVASAQFALPWSRIAGGGGTSTNGSFSFSGTIGQHDAGGPMTGGVFSLTGGFWVLPGVVPVSGAPTLQIVPAAPGEATVSWTPNTPGWSLQEAPDVTGPWTNAPSGATNPVNVPAVPPHRFYRLFKP